MVLAVTNDEYELIVYMTETQKDMERLTGVSRCSISRQVRGHRKSKGELKFIEVKDETMTAKEYLKQYEEAHRRALRCKAEYEAEREKIDSVRSTLGGDGMPHGSGISRKVEDNAIRLSDKAMKWKIAELDAIEKRQEVFEVISSIDGIEGDVLFEKYVNLCSWDEVAHRLSYSLRGVLYAHGRALQIVAKRIE